MKQHPNRLRALCGLLFALAATPAFAQQVVRVDVPFEFGTAKVTLPAGSYTVVDRNQIITITDGSGKHAVAVVAQRFHPDTATGKAMLVFHRYGPRYFLARVVAADDTTSDLTMSTAEKRVIQELRDVRAARNTVPQVVRVAAAER